MQISIEIGDLYEYLDELPSIIWNLEYPLEKICTLTSGELFVVLEENTETTKLFPCSKILIQKTGLIGLFLDWHKKIIKK